MFVTVETSHRFYIKSTVPTRHKQEVSPLWFIKWFTWGLLLSFCKDSSEGLQLGTVVNSGKRNIARSALQNDGKGWVASVYCRDVHSGVLFSICCQALFWAIYMVKPPNKGLMSWMQVYIAVTELKITLAKMPAREFSCLRKQKWRLLMVSSRVARPSPCLKILFGSVFSKAHSRFTLESQYTLLPQLALMGLNCIVALKQTLQHVG